MLSASWSAPLNASQDREGPTEVNPGQTAADGPASESTTNGPRTVDVDEIMAGDREVLIRHGSELYRLRMTRNGKLLLHK